MVRFAPFVAIAACLPVLTGAFSPNVGKIAGSMSAELQSAFQIAKDTSIDSTSKSSNSRTALDALTTTELPDKLYFKKETPKVLGGVKIGLRKLVVITGASSGLGLNCAVKLAETGRYFVVMACRDVEKAKKGTKSSHQFKKNNILFLSQHTFTLFCHSKENDFVVFLCHQ